MATKKEERGIRFDFGSADDLALSRKGEFRCHICFRDFVVPEIDIMIRGFSICPSCIQSGPHAVAAEAERAAGDKSRIATWEGTPEEQEGIAKEYLLTANKLRRFDSFMDIPGGAVAIAIASVKPEDLRCGTRKKAA